MQAFTLNHRLRKADEFSSVFLFRKTLRGKYFRFYYKPNQLDHSRLGLIVSKKRVHKHASMRNYIKRFLREYFRLKQLDWQSIDLIISVEHYFSKVNRLEVLAELDSLSQKFYLKKDNAK